MFGGKIGMPELLLILLALVILYAIAGRYARFILGGSLLGAFVGFLLRPSVPVIGQLPFSVVITRGSDLQGANVVFRSTAEQSFNHMLVGAIVGSVVLGIAGSRTKRRPAEIDTKAKAASVSAAPDSKAAASLSSSRFCTKCGEQLAADNAFCGDGLSDIVRVRNGEVCYWPNLGYGKFGRKVTMDHSPWFDDPDLFDQKRIKLADTDGSGTTDLLYLGRDGIKIFLNQSGNGWSSARALRPFAAANSDTSVSVVDFLGRGTACLLWSSTLPADEKRPLRYVDLMCGQKPHLLVNICNNLGAETRIEYASSTEFYLADEVAGTPWITRLPFPVHVVKRVETYDYVSRNRFVTSYTYHHGFFDGVEREFRGFGRVDRLDTEEFATLSKSSAFPVGENIKAESNVPPVLTKVWFHTGVYLGRTSRRYSFALENFFTLFPRKENFFTRCG